MTVIGQVTPVEIRGFSFYIQYLYVHFTLSTTMAVTYALPELSNNYLYDLEAFLNYHGLFGRELIHIYNDYGVFRTGYALVVEYNVTELSDYIADVEAAFNTKGQMQWQLVELYNNTAIFKKFSTFQATTPEAVVPQT